MKRSPSRYTIIQQHQKGQNSTKNISMLALIVELSIAVVEVDTKVINASLTQNQCLQCVTPSLTHVEIPRPGDATELNNDGISKLGDIHYQADRICQFFPKRFNQRRLQFLFAYFFLPIDLHCHVFPFEKLLLNVRLCLQTAFLMT